MNAANETAKIAYVPMIRPAAYPAEAPSMMA
jgi:hypothetical protein